MVLCPQAEYKRLWFKKKIRIVVKSNVMDINQKNITFRKVNITVLLCYTKSKELKAPAVSKTRLLGVRL